MRTYMRFNQKVRIERNNFIRPSLVNRITRSRKHSHRHLLSIGEHITVKYTRIFRIQCTHRHRTRSFPIMIISHPRAFFFVGDTMMSMTLRIRGFRRNGDGYDSVSPCRVGVIEDIDGVWTEVGEKCAVCVGC